jgi:general stress protein YciG
MNTTSSEVHETKTADKLAQPSPSQVPAAAAAGAHDLRPDNPPGPPDASHKLRRPRGFAAIDRKLLAEIASKGGKAAHSAGTAHEFTSAEAREAGRKGGLATHAKRRKTDE